MLLIWLGCDGIRRIVSSDEVARGKPEPMSIWKRVRA